MSIIYSIDYIMLYELFNYFILLLYIQQVYNTQTMHFIYMYKYLSLRLYQKVVAIYIYINQVCYIKKIKYILYLLSPIIVLHIDRYNKHYL